MPCFAEAERRGLNLPAHFFLWRRFVTADATTDFCGNDAFLSWQSVIERVIERTVTALGYELVDIERNARGLVRVFIDRVPGQAYESGPGEFVTVDDCETVTRQLQHVFEVENVDYERLEVSSPGLDRPLKKPADYERFEGQAVELTLKLPFQGRRRFGGTLLREGEGWRLVFTDERKVEQALDFQLSEVREARLVPVIDFKGRRAAAPPAQDADGGPQE